MHSQQTVRQKGLGRTYYSVQIIQMHVLYVASLPQTRRVTLRVIANCYATESPYSLDAKPYLLRPWSSMTLLQKPLNMAKAHIQTLPNMAEIQTRPLPNMAETRMRAHPNISLTRLRAFPKVTDNLVKPLRNMTKIWL